MIVKICGMTRVEDVGPAIDAGATHLGMIFADASKRRIDVEDAMVLRRAIPEHITPVGVFQDVSQHDVAYVAEVVGIKHVQLHGGFDDAAIPWLQSEGFSVVWATPVDPDGNWDAPKHAPDLLLLDTAKAGRFGGTGTRFDWAQTRRPQTPFLVAGGIGSDNVAAAVAALRPDGIDLAGSVESTPGIKDESKLQALKIALDSIAAQRDQPTQDAQMTSSVDLSAGRWGPYGGAYIPETLFAPVAELTAAWDEARADPAFAAEFDALMRNYVGRPSALTRVRRIEEAWNTQGPVYLKREDLNHTGAHKINNAIGQALLAKRMGKKRIIAETGAGQHGVATATVCALMGYECVVYMGGFDMERQALNVFRMRLLGAEVRSVESGSKTLKDAINEAMRDWVADPENTFYLLGSALGPHPYPLMVRHFHEVIGREAREQWLENNDRLPSIVAACVGGGSNSIGVFSGFMDDAEVALYGGEAAGDGVETGRHAARFAGGAPGVLHGTRTYLLQDGDGQIRETHSVSAGLDYPAIGPEHAWLADTGRATYLPIDDKMALAAFHELCRLEGIFPALESAHAVALAKHLVDTGVPHGNGILINLSGRGDKDVHTVAKIEGVEL